MQQLLWWTRLVGNLTLISLRTTAGIKRSSLSLVIAYKINQYVLKVCQFPVAWNEASVSLLLKKPGLDILFKSFCPVSNLPFVSKLTESAVYNQTHSHSCMNNLYLANQSSYKKNNSTETVLLRVKNDVLLNNVQSACNTNCFIRS